MFFNPNDFRRRQARTGPSGLLEIFSREWLTIIRVDLLACVSLVPIVTLPSALLAMNHMARRMAVDRGVSGGDFWRSFRDNFWRSYPTFFLAVLLPVISLCSSFFYAGRAAGNWMLFLPCVFSLFVFVVSLLMSAYLFPLAASGMPLGEAVRRSFALGFARPGQALLCALVNDVLAALAIGFLPFSIPYFLLGGLMFPCVAGQVIVRPVLAQFCPDPEEEGEEWEEEGS